MGFLMSTTSTDLSQYVRDFTDGELKDYTCFAGNFRDQRLEQGAMAFAESGPAVTRKVIRGLQRAVERWPQAEAGAALVHPLLED